MRSSEIVSRDNAEQLCTSHVRARATVYKRARPRCASESADREQRRRQLAEPRLMALVALRARDVEHAIELDVVEPDQLVVVAAIDVDPAEEHRLHRRGARRTAQRGRAA